MNESDIDDILSSFLGMWSNVQTTTSFPCAKLILLYPDDFRNLIRAFFDDRMILFYNVMIIDPICISEYFIFICLFTFIDLNHLLPLLLSIAGIQSNLFITKSQIYHFTQTYNLSSQEFEDIVKYLTKANDINAADNINDFISSSEDNYSLREFLTYIKNDDHFTSFFYKLGIYNKTHILNPKKCDVLIRRYQYYYLNPHNPNPPKESCIEFLCRKIFTDDLPPYHYDYRPIYSTLSSFDECIRTLRLLFGYSSRPKTLKLSAIGCKIKEAGSNDSLNYVAAVSSNGCSVNTSSIKNRYRALSANSKIISYNSSSNDSTKKSHMTKISQYTLSAL